MDFVPSWDFALEFETASVPSLDSLVASEGASVEMMAALESVPWLEPSSPCQTSLPAFVASFGSADLAAESPNTSPILAGSF